MQTAVSRGLKRRDKHRKMNEMVWSLSGKYKEDNSIKSDNSIKTFPDFREVITKKISERKDRGIRIRLSKPLIAGLGSSFDLRDDLVTGLP